MNRVQYYHIKTGKSDPKINVLQRIATVLEINVVEFFEAGKDRTEVNSMNKPLLQKVWLLEELDDTQNNSIYNRIDTAIAYKRLKEALKHALNIIT